MKQSNYGRIRAAGYDLGAHLAEITSFYLAQWERVGRPNPVLEPMCGTGLHLLPFLYAGADIDGLDASPYMLEQCRQKCQALGRELPLYEQFLEAISLPRQYGFIFIPDRSFGHIYDKATAQLSLKRLWEHLAPGGWLMLDVGTLAQLDNFGQPGQADFEVEDYPDGSTLFTTGIWGDVEDGAVIRQWNKYERYVDSKLIETEIFDYRERLYDRSEFEQMLRLTGFEAISVTKAYIAETEPVEKDGLVFRCHK